MRTRSDTAATFAARALLAMLALGCAGIAGAQVYKYTDEKGQVHYTDRAPSNATQLKGPPPPAQAPAAQPAPTRPAGNANANAANAAAAPPPPLPVNSAQARQVQRDVAAARVEECAKARENYDKAVRAQRVYKTNDKGEREYVSVAEADALRLQMKAEMDGVCAR